MRLRARPGSSGERHPHAAPAACDQELERAAARGGQQLRDHALEEHIWQQRQYWLPAPPRCHYISCSRIPGRLYRCGPRCSRAGTPTAPHSRDIPLPTLTFASALHILSAGPVNCEDAHRCRILGVAALLIPQGVAPDVGRRQYPQRCAAVAARVGSACALLSVCCLHASQDCSGAVLRLLPRSRRLSTSRPRLVHEHVRLIAVECRI